MRVSPDSGSCSAFLGRKVHSELPKPHESAKLDQQFHNKVAQHDHGSHGRNGCCLGRSGHSLDTDRANRAKP